MRACVPHTGTNVSSSETDATPHSTPFELQRQAPREEVQELYEYKSIYLSVNIL